MSTATEPASSNGSRRCKAQPWQALVRAFRYSSCSKLPRKNDCRVRMILCLNGPDQALVVEQPIATLGTVSRLFRDYRRAQSPSDLAVPMLQSDNRICR
jgi:hypothetical protein